jgi:hypothetical protein
MACACGGNRVQNDYLVQYKDGTSETFGTISQARIAVGKRGGTYKAVKRPIKKV